MTRRGLFKMLAATPLAGIVAKFAPKPEPWYMRNACKGYGLLVDPAVEHWMRMPGEICNCGSCKGQVRQSIRQLDIDAAFGLEPMPKIGSTLNIRRPHRANL